MNTCPICSSVRLFESGTGDYSRCMNCGSVRTRYHYDKTMYDKSYAENYEGYAGTPVNLPLQLFRVGLVSRWLHERDTILDIGCCLGEFLRFAENYYMCRGFEPNKLAVAKRTCRSDIHQELNGNIPPVNCITMFDVLEHIEEPKPFLKMLRDTYLRDNGIIALTTPNVAVVPYSDFFMKKWKHYKPQEHLYLYTRQGLNTMLTGLGFSVLHWGTEESDIRPGNPNGDILTCVVRRR